MSVAVLLLFTSLMVGCGGGGGETGTPDTNNGSTTTPDTNPDDNGTPDNGSTDGGSTDGGSTDGGSTDGVIISDPAPLVFINEASSTNSSFEDEDGDSPDWFELYNSNTSAIDLTGWSITDDSLEPTKWIFPEMQLAAGSYLRVWASDKDKANHNTFRTLVNRGDLFRFLVPQSTPSSSWTRLDYNDSSWQQGVSGIGYADGDDATLVPAGTTSVYARIIFNIDDAELIENLFLDMDFDDGFIAHINGVEVARFNMLEGTPEYDSPTIVDREATIYRSGTPQRFEITEFRSLLNSGDNVLAIQVHNISSSSSDLSLIPYLSAYYQGTTNDGVSPPTILAFQDSSLHTNFKISSSGETLTLFDSSGNQVDQLDVSGLIADKSIGRSLEDGSMVFYETPTPGSENSSPEYTGIILSQVEFSHSGGEFNGSSISLTGAGAGEVIRYTLDASIPNRFSPIYSSSINIDENTVVRAKVFRNNHIPSRTYSRTYITSSDHSLPIVTLVTEPDNFFDEQEGIYVYGPEENYVDEIPYFGANFWRDWEKDVHFSFYEPNGELGIALDAGVKIFGAWSRANDQRSLSIFARGRYGFSKLEYPLFPSLDYDSFEAIILRNSGNDWMKTNFRDAMMTSLMDGSGLETQAYRPVAVYLNGEYWGFYNIREKINEHFLDDKIDVDKSEINLLEFNGDVIEGNNDSYKDIISFITNNSLAVEANYQFIADQIDIENYITYLVAQIYADNRDWPGNNVKFWNSPTTKWRWILFDTDFVFGTWNDGASSFDSLSYALESDGPGWPNPPWSTLLFRKLEENNQFRNKLINQFADEFNGRFKASNVNQHIDAIASSISSEMGRHFSRWDQRPQTISGWQSEIDKLKSFSDERLSFLRSYITNLFGINGTFQLNLSINNSAGGSVQLNSLQINSTSWQGEYFDNIPVSLTAIPSEGYRFSHWQGDINSSSANLTLNRSTNTSLSAIFVTTN